MWRLSALALVVGCYSPRLPAGAPCADGVCPNGLVCSPATQTCERTAIDAAVGPGDVRADAAGDAARDAAGDAAGDASASPFAYRRRITIHNGASTALPAGFTIVVPIGATLAGLVAQGKVEADFSDLRVIGDGALGERDRIVDPPGGPAPPEVTFSLAAPIPANATDTSYALYYGRPGAGAPPANGAAVFTVYDDFTSGISSGWLQHGAPATSGGQLILHAGQTDALTTDASTDGLPIVSAVEVVARIADPTSDPTSQPEGTFYYWFGYQRTGDFSATDPWAAWIARGKGQVHAEQKSPVGCESECDGPDLGQDTAAHDYLIERDPTETRFFLDGAPRYTASVTNTEDYSIMVRNYLATSDVRIDWIRARARVSPDPGVTLGGEASP